MKSEFASIFHLGVGLLLWMLLSMFIHEYSHLTFLLLLGGKGYIYFNTCQITILPALYVFQVIVYLMGGIGAATFMAFCLSIEDDPEDRVILKSCIANQIVWGIGEALWFLTGYRTEIYDIAIILSAVAFMIVFIFGLKELFEKEESKLVLSF